MAGVFDLIVAAIALFFQLKNNNKQVIKHQIPQKPVNYDNPYYNFHNF